MINTNAYTINLQHIMLEMTNLKKKLDLIKMCQNILMQNSITNVNLKFAIIKSFQLIVFNLKEEQYFC